MPVRFTGSGSEKNWVWRRLIFFRKELTKGSDRDPDRDWSLGLCDFNEGTAGESDGMKLAVLPHLVIFHRAWGSSAI